MIKVHVPVTIIDHVLKADAVLSVQGSQLVSCLLSLRRFCCVLYRLSLNVDRENLLL